MFNHKEFVISVNAKSSYEPGGPLGWSSYPGFCSMKRLGVFLLPLGGMLVHRRVRLPPALSSPFILLGVERHSESKASVLPRNTTQYLWLVLKPRELDPETRAH